MSPAQADLLTRCIEADRRWRSHKEAGDYRGMDERGVEVGQINGVSANTATSLEAAGLIEIVNLHGRHGWAFLGKYQPFDEFA